MKKFLLILLGIVVFLIAAAIAIPFLFKDKIVAKVKEEINKNVNAKVNFSDFDLSIIRSFPNLTFSLDDLSVVGINEFDGDTLAYIKTFNLKLNIWDVIGGSQMTIKSISLDKPYINILVLQDGKANYDIAKVDTAGAAGATAEPSSFKLALKSYSLSDGKIIYDDRSVGFKVILNNLDHTGKGDFTADLFTLVTNTEAEKTNLWFGGVKYLDNVKTKLDMDLEMDMKNFKFTFKENELALNELVLGMDGWLAMPKEDIDMDLKWKVKKNDFRNFISMVPGIYREGFKDLKSSGTLAMNGFVKGTYNETKMPGYGLNLKIDKGMFQYPSLPTAVNNVNVDLAIDDADGVPDHTIINLRSMHMEFGTEPFDAKLYVITPVSDANIDAMIKGTVNLANMKNIIPMDKGTDLNGIVKMDLAMKGKYSSIEKKEFDKFNAAGTFAISNMTYKSPDYPAATINNMMLSFNPRNVTLNDFNMVMGKSDIKANGSIDNLLGYYFNNELLKGTFNLNSNLLDLNEMMTGQGTAGGTAAPPDTAQMTVIEVPANVDFTLNSTVGKILYDNMVIDNLKGALVVKDAAINMQNLVFNILNGGVRMSGKYSTPNPNKPDFDYDLSLTNFDIQQTVKTFNTVKKLAPIAERATGKFSSDLTVTGKLDQHMQPIYSTLTGGGKLSTQSVTLNNFEPLNKLADALKMPEYKQLQVQNVNLNFKFKDGRVNVEPFETNLAGAKATISGSNGFDQSIDYKINLAIPKSKIPAAAQNALGSAFASANKLAGTSFQLPDPLKVNIGMGGTITSPTIKTDLSGQGGNIKEAIKEEIKEKIKEKVEDVKKKGREEADKIMAEAQKQAQAIRDGAKATSDKVKQEGYAAADKVVNEAKNPIAKAAANATAKKMKQETDKKAQQVIDEGNKKAQDVLDAAKKKSDDLLK